MGNVSAAQKDFVIKAPGHAVTLDNPGTMEDLHKKCKGLKDKQHAIIFVIMF